jgi:hypothetical protein
MQEHEFKIVKEIEPNGRVWFKVFVNGVIQKSEFTYEEAKEVLETCKRNIRQWKQQRYKEVVYLERWEG